MAGREYLFSMCRRASRSTVLVALVAVCLTVTGLIGWQQASAERSVNAAKAASASVASNASLASLDGRTFLQSDGSHGAVLGEFEGQFDAKSNSLSIQPRVTRTASGKDNRLYTRADPGAEVGGFTWKVLRSQLVNTGSTSATVTGEVELTNATNVTLYNARVVFTTFKLTNAGGADAGNLPSANGFAYFNDGQVAFNNKLNVSRAYGDLAAGAKTTRVWTFAVNNQPPNFFFAFKVLADIGVAAESVAPAAVQVNASTGTSVTISGRGFTGTPTVELLNSGGSVVAALTGVTATANSITATVPAGTAAGNYSVRVTNPGGTPGGANSSVINGRLTVTPVPTKTLSGSIGGGAFAEPGPYLITGNSTIGSSTPIPAGTVVYIAGGASITVDTGGNIAANGGIPGVASKNPAQIVFTAQRSPGASLPTNGAWGGFNMTAASSSTMGMRNVVIEYGGTAGLAAINMTGSGRTLSFTDGIIRTSGGSAIAASGATDSVIGFARNRIENNGTSATDPALLLSGNASLGLFDIDTTVAGSTSVGDASFYYSSANDFSGNQVNAVQIGTNASAASNDFSKSGVLVGQGSTPIRIAGSCSNPAIVGAAPPASPAELTITPEATIQLAADLNLQAGDYATNRVGCIAANGYAGAYLGSQAGAPVANKLISFDKVPSGGNFSAIFFARNAMANCILNYVTVQNGGAASACSLGNGEVIADGTNVRVTNSQITNSATGGLLALSGAKIDSNGTTFSGNTPIIETVVGGILGDGNVSNMISMVTPVAVATDPLGRGVYFVDATNSGNLIRFFNTTRNTATVGGLKIAAGTIRTVVGGGLDPSDNVPGRNADPGSVSGLAVSNDGESVYFTDSGAAIIRVFNASANTKMYNGQSIGSGRVGTFSTSPDFGSNLNGLAVHPTTGELYVGDATAGNNKVFKVAAAGGNATTVAGNGAVTKPEDTFAAGAATSTPLLQPRAITFDPQGNLYISDTGHGRIIRVDAAGAATLMAQFPPRNDPSATPYNKNPFSTGMTFFNGKLHFANGNTQDIARIDSPGNFSTVAGVIDIACDYSSSNCGDGGSITEATFNMIGSTGQPPLAAIAADSKGLFVMDQGSISKGRIRYLNLTANDVEVAGLVIPGNTVNTVAGTGLTSPFDGGLASSGAFNTPSGVGVDANGNLWITDTLVSRLRFVNCSITPVTIFAGTSAEQVVQPGTVVTVNKDVGSGSTDGVPVNQAGFDTPQGLAVTAQGIFIADAKKGASIQSISRRTGLVRFINTTSSPVVLYSGAAAITVPPGNIATVVGGSTDPSNVGDGANPLGARLLGVTDVAVHPTTGDIYIADAGQQTGSAAAARIRRVNRQTGAVSTILTGGVNDAFVGLSFDSTGRLLVANAGRKTSNTNLGNSAILREKASGQCATNATGCFDTILSGGTGSLLKNPRDVAEGPDGALYVTNAGPSEFNKGDHKILRITISGTTGTATVFAGGNEGYSGDGGPAANSELRLIADDFNVATVGTAVNVRSNVTITVAPTGAIIFADSKNNAIRRIR